MTKEEYEYWFRHSTKRQKIFVNTYLKTLDPEIAYQAAGYNYSNAGFGKWKVFNRLFPVIQYKTSQYEMSVDKNFIVNNWLKLLYSGDNITRSTALKELSRLFGYVDQSSKVQIENNLPQVPVVIKFDEKQLN